MDARSTLQHPASASWVQTSTTATSTIRIRHTATVSSIGKRIHTVYAVQPVGYFILYNLPTENMYTLYMPFSPLAIFLFCSPRLRMNIYILYMSVLHCMHVSTLRSMTFFNVSYVVHSHILLPKFRSLRYYHRIYVRTLERSFNLYCGIAYYPTT